jgi:hypothetical protein
MSALILLLVQGAFTALSWSMVGEMALLPENMCT